MTALAKSNCLDLVHVINSSLTKQVALAFQSEIYLKTFAITSTDDFVNCNPDDSESLGHISKMCRTTCVTFPSTALNE